MSFTNKINLKSSTTNAVWFENTDSTDGTHYTWRLINKNTNEKHVFYSYNYGSHLNNNIYFSISSTMSAEPIIGVINAQPGEYTFEVFVMPEQSIDLKQAQLLKYFGDATIE